MGRLKRAIKTARLYPRGDFLNVVAMLRVESGIPLEDMLAVGITAQEAWEAGYRRGVIKRVCLGEVIDRSRSQIVRSAEPDELLYAALGCF